MNYVQIWIGEEPGEELIECMKSVVDCVHKDDKYFLITSPKWTKEFSFLKGKNIKIINVNTYIRDMLKDTNIECVWNYIPKNKKFFWAQSDVIRYHFLSTVAETLYCDTDIKLEKSLTFEDCVHFGIYSHPFIDCNIMYNGSNTNFFKEFLINTINKYLAVRDKLHNSLDIFPKDWAFAAFNKKIYRKQIIPITSGYIHLNWSNRGI